VAIWVTLFILVPRSRAAMFWTGLLFVPAGPLSEYWQLKDYWHPIYLINLGTEGWRFGLEDCLLAFTFAGISAGIFEILVQRKSFERLPRFSFKTALFMLVFYVLALCLMALFTSVLHFNSIYGMMFSGYFSFLFLMFYGKWKMFPVILLNAIIISVIFWLCYIVYFIPIFPSIITAWWELEAISGIMLFGVPLEEPLAAFASALMLGPIFRLCSIPYSEGAISLGNIGSLLEKSYATRDRQKTIR
jgi:hypothetical protein